MPHILITSGPTREYLDPVRFLTNASSGRMGAALAEAVLEYGAVPVVVSGQVQIDYPVGTEVHWIETTQQMLQCCLELLPQCDGIIGAAAPCDFRPVQFSQQKIKKTYGESEHVCSLTIPFQETPDILATLGKMKQPRQWSIGFALETADLQGAGKRYALKKLRKKNCDLIVLNSAATISCPESTFCVYDAAETLRLDFTGTKRLFAKKLLELIVPDR